MDGWIPVFRYRGTLVHSKCPICRFLIAVKRSGDPRKDGVLLCCTCVRCGTTFPEGLVWT